MSAEDELGVAVDATIERIRARRRERFELTRRALSVWRLYHDHGWKVPVIARRLREGVKAGGVNDEDADGAGIRRDNVRRMVEGPQPVLEAFEDLLT